MGRYIASSGGNVKASGEIREPFCVFEEIKKNTPNTVAGMSGRVWIYGFCRGTKLEFHTLKTASCARGETSYVKQRTSCFKTIVLLCIYIYIVSELYVFTFYSVSCFTPVQLAESFLFGGFNDYGYQRLR